MTSCIIPCLRYKDAPAAIDWLEAAFGFQRHAVYEGEDGMILHAELSYKSADHGRGMIMLGSDMKQGDYAKFTATPSQAGAKNTQTAYIIVPEVDAHYARAKEAGAEIIIDIKDESYGGRGYTCRDPEGYVWSFGSYDPWRNADTQSSIL
ncbi:glyoxalase [bacterium]|nr:glyoxalase [bacterium]